MIISEELSAAARVRSTREAELFDDIGCLLLATRGSGGHLWVHDASTGAWIEAPDAFFVQQQAHRTPMGFGVVAFARDADAQARAETFGGEVMRLADVLARIAQVEPIGVAVEPNGGS